MKGIVVAGTHSGCGKTTVTLALLSVLTDRGLRVQSYKAGPDYIDPGLHRMITGRPSQNLDLWMCGRDEVRRVFERYMQDVDFAVIEGVMGMYDGDCNTALLADVLALPVLLVVDAYGMAESAGAVVKGYSEYGKASGRPGGYKTTVSNSAPMIAGVLFNRVSSEGHFRRLKSSVKGIPVIGYLPSDKNFGIPERHLGLTVAEENPLSDENIRRLTRTFSETVDIGLLLSSVQKDDISVQKTQEPPAKSFFVPGRDKGRIRIAVAYDKAFCFYYDYNLDLLREEGAEITLFSPLNDKQVPGNVDLVYIGGGYPEIFSEQLSLNRAMMDSCREWSLKGGATYAECGGLIYLSRAVIDLKGIYFGMADVFPFEMEMKKRRSYLGYREVEVSEEVLFYPEGGRLRGHEFHYSEIKGGTDSVAMEQKGISCVYRVLNKQGDEIKAEGYRRSNTLASYIHIHFGSSKHLREGVRAFIKKLKEVI